MASYRYSQQSCLQIISSVSMQGCLAYGLACFRRLHTSCTVHSQVSSMFRDAHACMPAFLRNALEACIGFQTCKCYNLFVQCAHTS